MKKSSFFAGMLTMLLILGLGGTAFAAAYQRQATLNYQGIKITLDGEEITPKDGAGNVVEPFTIDGTTYLPVRAISNALGLGVDWDGETNTVILTSSENLANGDEWAEYEKTDVHDCYADFSVPSINNVVGHGALVDIYELSTGDGILYTYDKAKFGQDVKSSFQEKYGELLEYYGFELCLVEEGPDVEYVDRISGLVVAMYPSEDNPDYYCVLLMHLPDKDTSQIIERADFYAKYVEKWETAVEAGLTDLSFAEWWLEWQDVLLK